MLIFCVCVYIHACMHVAKLLADQWKSCTSTHTLLPVRTFRIARDSTAFGEYYDHVQEGLRMLAGIDELMAGKYILLYSRVWLCTTWHLSWVFDCHFIDKGMLSKSRSQVLWIAPVLHVLFHLGNDGEVPDIVSEAVIVAAINFTKVSCQQTSSVIAGKGSVEEVLQRCSSGMFNIILKLELSVCPCVCTRGRSPEASRPWCKSYLSLRNWSLHVTASRGSLTRTAIILPPD